MAEDIRFSKKAATLTHASARGKVKRNAGNFTRGSQLFHHEILMTWAGIRMPLYVWVGTAVLLLCILVSLTFKNHEVQLVLMKLYAEAWGWVQLNPNKPVNLTLPSGQMVQGTMSMVPYHPAVERAWGKAVQVSISAGLGAAFICVPLTVWFVDFSKRRGTDILTERHERGAVLVTHGELAKAITSHNWKAHVSECRKRRPAVDPDKILAEPLKDRVRAGLHAPYRLAGVPVPWRLEQSHVEELVMPVDISDLPSMHGFVKFPDGFPAARIRLTWKDYEPRAKGFERVTDMRAAEYTPPSGDGAEMVGGDREGAQPDIAPKEPKDREEVALSEAERAAQQLREAIEGPLNPERELTEEEVTRKIEDEEERADFERKPAQGELYGYTHAVIAAITQDKDGNWKALWNGEIWKNNTVLGSIYNAALRTNLEKLGYETQITGKHGQFEIKGVARDVIEAFSQRRLTILATAEKLGKSANDTEALREITKRTRDPKLNPDDKLALRQEWAKRAAGLGFDAKALVEQARERGSEGRESPLGSPQRVQETLSALRDSVKLYTRPADTLTTNGLQRITLTPTQLRTEMATASAIRIIGERETSWTRGDLVKTALDLGVKGVTADGVEARIGVLVADGRVLEGKSDRLDGRPEKYTTPEHVEIERATLANVAAGKGAGHSIIEAAEAPGRLRQVAGPHDLNAEQIAAGTLALASKDRTVVIQGVAGAGKTTIISAIASVAHQEGREVLGLAFANKMVSDLRTGTEIRGPDGEVVRQEIAARTVSSFVNEHLRPALAGSGPKFEASREALRGKVLVLDEASLVANKPMNDLLTIANRLGVEKLVMIGDRAQLQPIEAGKSFSLIQSDNPAMARIDTSLRQRTEHMKEAAGLVRAGMFKESFAALGERIVEAGADHLKVTAQKWLELPPDDRERTAIYSSGRAARGELNRMVQQGLKAEGAIQGEGLRLTTLLPAHATREELRYASTYSKGQLLEVTRQNAPGGLVRGRYDVEGIDAKGRVMLRDESSKLLKFDPAAIDPSDKRDALRLSEKHKETIYEGDKIRWTEKDDARGLMKSEEARIIGIRDGIVTLENKAGETVELKQNDRMLERMGLAYAINMHQAQGDTRDMAIGEMHSSARHLSNQRLALVMMTRVRDDITIVTNDRDRLLAQIGRNPGDKTSALETLGEKQVEAKRSGREAGEFRPTIPDHLRAPEDRQASASRIDPASLRATPQLDVPERNIERSR